MFTFTPLLGAQSASQASQSLLELDGGVKILVDVGWDAAFDASQLEALQSHVSTLSLVLLTHPTTDHIGAYAHCCKHVPNFSRIPCYATTPVVNLGRTLLTDLYSSSPLAASIIPSTTIPGVANESSPNLLLQPPSADEIASYFALVNPLKYSQPHQPIPSPFSGPLSNLTITAYSAGHTLGGTIWHVQHGLESIVYAADWNQGRENLFSGAAWLSTASGGAEIIEPLRRPTALVCSSKGVEKDASQVLGRKKRDDMLISLIRETIAQGGKVLIPTDSSARVLEQAFVLEHTWRENMDGPHAGTYKNTAIFMASKTSSSTVKYLQSMLEWMEDGVIRDAEAIMTGRGKGPGSKSPLEWQHVKQLERKSQIERALRRQRPCVMLASDASLEWGFSRQVLEGIAGDPRNLVILTDQDSRGLGKTLWDLYSSRAGQVSAQSGAKVVSADGESVLLKSATTAPLSTEETVLYEQYVTHQRQLHSTQQGDNTLQDATNADLAEQEADESSDEEEEDEDAEHQGRALNLSAQMNSQNKRKLAVSDAELGINVLLRSKNVHDYDVRNKRGRERVFPHAAARHRSDEFGEAIKPEDFLRAEERDDIDGVDLRNGVDGVKDESGVGQKRKWDEAASAAASSSPKGKAGKGPRPKKQKPEEKETKHEPDDIDAAIARATGQSLGSDGVNGDNGMDDSSGDEDEDSDYEPEETVTQGAPQKAVFETKQLELRCRVAHVDFTGLHEKRDLQMLIPLIRPRKLILIAGSATETQTLAAECRQLLTAGNNNEGGSGSEVFAPLVGESVDASVDTNAWMLKLSRQLVKKLTWQNVKGLGVVALTGKLDVELVEDESQQAQTNSEAEEAKRKKQKLIKGEEGIATAEDALKGDERAARLLSTPVLDLLAAQTASATTSQQQRALATQPVHVGDLRLADLRRLLQSTGHSAEFRGEGTLLIDGTVVVRKSASGRVEVESAGWGMAVPQYRTKEGLGSFFAVKKAIYEGLAVIAGV